MEKREAGSVVMASWADGANGDASVDQENFKAERIISQSQDGREKVRQQLVLFVHSQGGEPSCMHHCVCG